MFREEHVCLPGIDLNKAVLLDLNEPGMEPEEDEGVFPNTRMNERGDQEELARYRHYLQVCFLVLGRISYDTALLLYLPC